MRITRSTNSNKEYWMSRWTNIPADEPMSNEDVYPLKYSNMIVKEKGSLILEAGCGAGRLLRYYHNKGFNIEGFDFVEEAITKLKAIDPSLKVEIGDVMDLRYKNNS